MAEVKLLAWLLLIPLIPYLILLLSICRKFSPGVATKRGIRPAVPLSVIIPCHNEERRLPFILNDLALQDYSADNFEVVVVDDNSDDRTFHIASSFKDIRILKVVSNQGRGKKAAIKNGIKAATGELIITTDADCRMTTGWLWSLVDVYSETRSDLIISPVIPERNNCLFDWFQQLEFLSLQAITAGTALAGRAVMCNGANIAFPLRIYRENSAKLRDEILSGDDIFLLQSIRRSGGKIVWNGANDSAVRTAMATGVRQFLNQRARWLSKAGAYNDPYAILLSVVALFTNISLASLLLGSLAVPGIFLFWLAALLVKSVPDFTLLYRMARVYKKTDLLWWFIPSQVIYPFYVITVSAYSIFRRNRW